VTSFGDLSALVMSCLAVDAAGQNDVHEGLARPGVIDVGAPLVWMLRTQRHRRMPLATLFSSTA
jgi:hypothetical protein